MMKEYFFDADGVKLNYVKGPNNGPALVLLPGQSTTWQSYEPVFEGLSKSFQVYSLSIRGHGKSDWTTGDYNFNSIGKDLTLFLKKVVKRPAILAGNSSGGLISLWLGVNRPELANGVVLEDAPLFSADWPQIKKEFVYEVLSKTAKYLGREGGADYLGFFNSIRRPLPNGKTKTLPEWLSKVLAWLVYNRERKLGKIILTILPRTLRMLVYILPTFDPDFSRAWVDGRIYKGLDHEKALKKIKAPLLIIHANWFRTEKGLIGAMDDNDAKKARRLAPHAKYIQMKTQHVTHSGKPKEFIRIINEFEREIK
ncbi:MAG: alpha/beta hydrolase [Parcubacteria group bacterium]|nr:MAG: alpha/beta hydrolase [Parcubacteria group bacterium]